LSKEQIAGVDQLPRTLKKLIKDNKIQVQFEDGDLKSHKKYYYAIRDYSDHPILTVDDDIIYPENLVEVLLESQEKNPQSVICTHGHRLLIEDNNIIPYDNWDKETQIMDQPRKDIVPIGCGGVLYPAHCFDGSQVLDTAIIEKTCRQADDLWLKSQAAMNGHTTVKVSTYPYFFFIDIIIRHNIALTSVNVGKNLNDIQFANIKNEYPELIEALKER